MLRQALSGLPRMNEVRLPGQASPVITQPCAMTLTISMQAFNESGGLVMQISVYDPERAPSPFPDYHQQQGQCYFWARYSVA